MAVMYPLFAESAGGCKAMASDGREQADARLWPQNGRGAESGGGKWDGMKLARERQENQVGRRQFERMGWNAAGKGKGRGVGESGTFCSRSSG